VFANYKIGYFEVHDFNQGYAFPFRKKLSFCKKSLQIGFAHPFNSTAKVTWIPIHYFCWQNQNIQAAPM
jgi:hypothetical protein